MFRRIWVAAAMWITWFIRRLPARESRCQIWAPLEASSGAVPVQEANRFRVANRATFPTSTRILAAPAGPRPYRSIRCEPRPSTASRSLALSA